MDINRRTAEKVDAAIESSGMTLAAVAEQASVPRVTLIRRLSGTSPFRIDELERVADVLGVPFLSLIGEDVA